MSATFDLRETLTWSQIPPQERDRMCANFLPASPVNPIREVFITKAGADIRTFLGAYEKAEEFLSVARKSRSFWRGFMGPEPWKDRNKVGVRTSLRYLPYSQCIASAWLLVAAMQHEGFACFSFATPISNEVSFRRGEDWLWPSAEARGTLPIHELIAIAFLVHHQVTFRLEPGLSGIRRRS